MNNLQTPNKTRQNHNSPESCDQSICFHLSPSRRLLHPCGGEAPAPNEVSGSIPDVPPCLLSHQQHSVVGVEGARRIALMVTPEPSGQFMDQAWEAMSTIRAILRQQGEPMAVTTQTVYLRDTANREVLRRLMEAFYGDRMPVTIFIPQAPCDGAELAIEAWAVSTLLAEIRLLGPDTLTVSYDGLRWIHVAAEAPEDLSATAYAQSRHVFQAMEMQLRDAGAGFDEVVRAWLYQGGITELEDGTERYRELNRARTDFFEGMSFGSRLGGGGNASISYPASTGIGTRGRGLRACGMALQTQRADVRLVSLENPLQTPSFDYARRYSMKSPKFSRAMAVAIGDYATVWISGTASIVDSETVHLGDVELQTEQTLTNIERLIDAENCERHGLKGAGFTLSDLAKARVYVKRLEDFERCRAVCQRRIGAVPVIYANADICRPDLLVEIEAVAFSPIH